MGAVESKLLITEEMTETWNEEGIFPKFQKD